MKKVGGLIGLILALCIGYFIFKAEMTQGPAGGAPPQQVIDTTGVEGDLVAIGHAEKMYLASHGTYANLDQLKQEGMMTFSDGTRRGYAYVIDFNGGQSFSITASPTDPAKKDWPTVSMDDTMQISKQ
jgi:hypothetical protein